MIPERIRRLEQLLKKELAVILLQEVKDPRLNFISVMDVHLSGDVRNADIYVTTHDDSEEHIKEVMAALDSAGRFIRHALSQHVVLRLLPALKFHYDKTIAQATRIESLLHQLKKETHTANGD